MTNKKQQQILSAQEIRELKTKLHHIKPVVIIGNKGLTDAVIQETDRALNDHELIKIRIHTQDRKEMFDILDEICNKTNATSVQIIGHVIAIYRKDIRSEED